MKEVIKTEKDNNGWISVKDRLPDSNRVVLAITRMGGYMVVLYKDGSWFNGFIDYLTTDTFTHWRTLPAPPSEE